jgi:hypothetical protein
MSMNMNTLSFCHDLRVAAPRATRQHLNCGGGFLFLPFFTMYSFIGVLNLFFCYHSNNLGHLTGENMQRSIEIMQWEGRAHLNKDYKDWFHYHGDWSKVTVPNALEKQVYGFTTTMPQQQTTMTTPAMKGYIVLCFVACKFNNCPKDSTNDDALTSDGADMRVNHKVVTELTHLELTVYFKWANRDMYGNAPGMVNLKSAPKSRR